MSRERPKFLFGDIVVIHGNKMGVVVKSWHSMRDGYTYDVYNRMTSQVEEGLREADIDRYRVRHKYLSDEEMEWQYGYK